MNTPFFRELNLPTPWLKECVEFPFLLLTVIDDFSCLCSLGSADLKCEEDFEDCILNAHEKNSTCEDLHPISIHKCYYHIWV